MTCYRSIGLTELVALMASHRSVECGQSTRPGELDPEEFTRISIYLRNGARAPAPGRAAPRFQAAQEHYSQA